MVFSQGIFLKLFMRNRHWFAKFSLIALASAAGSAAVTALSTIIMAEATKPKPSQGQDSDDEANSTGKDNARKGIVGKVSEIVNDLRNQLPNIRLPKPPPVLDSFSMESVVRYIQAGKAKNIIVMTGAGISTSAGIPDFRSPGTGLYDNLAEYNLPHPQAIFEIGYFRENPEPFFKLARELFPSKLKPTPCHFFIRLLHEKGMLLRNYTQNVDALEHIAGIPPDKIVEAHGTFRQGHCVLCGKEYTLDWTRGKIATNLVPRCEVCDNVVKPDVILFGESLPAKFFLMSPQDFSGCDLLIIMGTSLQVHPFASLIDRVGARVPRLLINKDKAGKADPIMHVLGLGGGLQYDDDEANYRDVYWSGTCDDGCLKLAELLEWADELRDLMKREWAKVDAQSGSNTDPGKIEMSDSEKDKSTNGLSEKRMLDNIFY